MLVGKVNKKETLRIRILEVDKEKLRSIARIKNISLTQLTLNALEEYLENHFPEYETIGDSDSKN
jgi:hypothetical protein